MNPNHLTPGHLLHQRYSIQYSLGQGGFGITYLAYDQKLDQEVCIKELFVSGMSMRESTMAVNSQTTGDFSFSDFVQCFIQEARQLARFQHSNIVRVIDYFEENNTAYMVMEYVEGKTLKQKVQREGALSENEALALMHQLLDAVEEVHNSGLLHRDITPDNILISQKGRLVLIDFGSAREFAEGKTSTQTAMLKPGYAPAEQYSNRSKRGKYTDIYALGATLYFLLTAQKPIASTVRISEDLIPPHQLNPKVSSQVSSAVMLAMEMKPENRFRDVAEMREAIKILPPPNPQAWWYVLLALAVAFGAYWLFTEPSPPIEEVPMEEVIEEEPVQEAIEEPVAQPTNSASSIQKLQNDMVYVAGGGFTMGCTAEQGSDCGSEEKPAHQVSLGGFYMSKSEVTQAQWKAVMGNNPSYNSGCENCPVEQVSWDDVQEFILKLNQMTGKNYRLPTEAEWEYAARGGSKSKGYKYSGSSSIDQVAWYNINSGSKTHPVGQKQPNELGLYDMTGNVLEWCSDWYGAYSTSAQSNPKGPTSGSRRIRRGGSFNFNTQFSRLTFRHSFSPESVFSYLGFRIVLSDSDNDNFNTEDEPSIEDSQSQIELIRDNMVYVYGGTFSMGCTAEQGSNCEGDERPAHQVSLSGFYMSKYEVTQAQWREVMGSNPSYLKNCDNCPVDQVSWDDVQKFIRKLNQMTGKSYRLPTEAEWEYAARGGNKSKGYKYSGSNSIDQVAWYDGNSGSKTHPVGQKQPNELGLYDMTGNVWEWCSDWYGDYRFASQTNPKGPTSGSYRVNRGGSYSYYSQRCRVSYRNYFHPDFRYDYLGFRLVSAP